MNLPSFDLSKTETLRIAAAIIVLPVVAFVITLAAYPLLYPGFDQRFVSAARVPLTVSVAVAVTICAFPLSVIGAMCTVGLRLVLGRVFWWQALIVGVVVGNIPLFFFAALAFLASIRRGYGWSVGRLFDLRPMTLGSLLGLVCAFVFWQIAGHAFRASQRA
jgi:hypothetical protein